MRELVDGQRESWLDQRSYKTIIFSLSQDSLYAELKTIDNLWTKYSNGRFGFSVQNKIFLESGGKRFNIDQKSHSKKEGREQLESVKKFGDKVGWRENAELLRAGKRQWIPYHRLTFNDLAPRGHLPLPRVRFTGFWGVMSGYNSLPLGQAEDAHPEVQSGAFMLLWFGFLVSGTECD